MIDARLTTREIDFYLYLSTDQEGKPFEIIQIYDNNDLRSCWLKKLSNYIYTFTNLLSVRNKSHLLIQPLKGVDFYNYPLKSIINDGDLPKIKYDQQVIQMLLKMLDNDRFYSWKTLRQLCMILYFCHITNTNENINFYKIWKKLPGGYGGSRKEIWETCAQFLQHKLNIISLYYYAHVDSPILFEKIAAANPSFRDMLLQKNEKNMS
jgi:hypothetical protein